MPTTTSTSSWLNNLSIQHKVLLAMALLLAAALTAQLLTLNSLRKQETARQWYVHTYTVLHAIDQTRHAAKTVQAGVRGYLITANPADRQAYDDNLLDMGKQLPQLRTLTADNPLEQSRIDRLEAMLAQWRQEVADGVSAPMLHLDALPRAQRADARQDIQDAYINHRTVRAAAILTLLDQMSDTEQSLLNVRTAALDQQVARSRWLAASFMLLLLLAGLVVLVMCFRQITRPLHNITLFMNRLAAHDHTVEIRQLTRRDEIGQIARALQVFKDMVIATREQAGLKSDLADITRQLQEAETLAAFAENLLGGLLPKLTAGIGVLHVFDSIGGTLAPIGGYGLAAEVPESHTAQAGSLPAQCAAQRRAIMLDELPADYPRITSGSGGAAPRHLELHPLLWRDGVIGVLEFAGFVAPTPLQQQFLEQLLPTIALSLDNLAHALQTKALLAQARLQGEQLRTNEITLRQQQDALRQSNDSLHAKTMALEEQSQRLLVSEEELRVQTEELQASNEELRLQGDTLHEQKRVLEALQQETAAKAIELERASRYKSEFLANMSHELRTPLNSLLILSRNLADNGSGRLGAEEVESARVIHDAGSSLLRLINDILDLSKIEAGKMELAPDDCSLPALARSLHRRFDHVARDKQLPFEVSLASDLPASIHTDPGKLEQILNNLLANAFKFTATGSVRVNMQRPMGGTAGTVGNPPPCLTIQVIDTGIGIPADKQQKVFAAFEQADTGTSRQYGGTGLGLSISRHLASLLGGQLTLHSEAGQGSTFTLELPELGGAHAPTPAATPPSVASDQPPAAPTPPPPAAMSASGSTILIVEDDPSFARVLTDLVHEKGLTPLLATCGKRALELARSEHPRGILLDVIMPDIDGLTTFDRLRADPATRAIPVHFLTAVADLAESDTRGALGILNKPASRAQIHAAIDRLLQASGQGLRRLQLVAPDATGRAALRELLQGDDLVIDEAADVEQALSLRQQHGCDCIVLDLAPAPRLDFLQRLAATDNPPPVVIYADDSLDAEEHLRLRQFTDSIVLKSARAPERLLDEVNLFLHRIQQHPAASASEIADGLQGYPVLLVDDDMRNLFALSKVLRDWGLKVGMAQDGPHALRMLAEGATPALVLMDIMMPGMDGYETIRQIRAQPAHAQLPIIALTAKAMRGDREQCLAAGANDYLSKPLDLDKLNAMIRVWLRR